MPKKPSRFTAANVDPASDHFVLLHGEDNWVEVARVRGVGTDPVVDFVDPLDDALKKKALREINDVLEDPDALSMLDLVDDGYDFRNGTISSLYGHWHWVRRNVS
jgi:hypothetical protein